MDLSRELRGNMESHDSKIKADKRFTPSFSNESPQHSTKSKMGTFTYLNSDSYLWRKQDIQALSEVKHESTRDIIWDKIRQPTGDVQQNPKWFQLCDEIVIYSYFDNEAPNTIRHNINQYEKQECIQQQKQRSILSPQNKNQIKSILKVKTSQAMYTTSFRNLKSISQSESYKS